MSNGLRDMIYGGGGYSVAQAPDGGVGPSSTLGSNFGFNVGSETFRVQLAISGLLLAAVAVLVFMHTRGHRFSVHV